MENNFNDAIAQEKINEGNIVVLDFSATWCAPCRAISPIIDKLGEKYNSETLTIGKIDIDENKILSTNYGVRNIPTVLFFKNGQLVDRLVGLNPEKLYVEKIEHLINL